MKLEYALIEDRFDDVTQMRTKTEQAPLPDGSWLIRTVVYTPYLITAHVNQVMDAGKRKKTRKKKSKKGSKRKIKQASLFDPIEREKT